MQTYYMFGAVTSNIEYITMFLKLAQHCCLATLIMAGHLKKAVVKWKVRSTCLDLLSGHVQP